MFVFSDICRALSRAEKALAEPGRVLGAAPVFIVPERSLAVAAQVSAGPELLEEAGLIPPGSCRSAVIRAVPRLLEGLDLMSPAGDTFSGFHDVMRSMTVLLHAERSLILLELGDDIVSPAYAAGIVRILSAAEDYREQLLLLVSVSPEKAPELEKILKGRAFFETVQLRTDGPEECAEYCVQRLSELSLQLPLEEYLPLITEAFDRKKSLSIADAELLAREMVWAAGSAEDPEKADAAVRKAIDDLDRSDSSSSGERIGF
ncbi:MAG: hypothetical protein IJ071_11305 [Ruminococcus sp.]|nr:hypothetical protein [Ruminococcus sp.]